MPFRDPVPESERAECETLYMDTRWLPEECIESRIAIGATEHNSEGDWPTVSLQIITADKHYHYQLGCAWLTPEEIDRVIAALEKAKQQILEMNSAWRKMAGE